MTLFRACAQVRSAPEVERCVTACWGMSMVGRAGAADSPMEAALRARLEELVPGVRVTGAAGVGAVDVVAVRWHGANFMTLTYRDDHGATGQVVLGRDREPQLRLGPRGRSHPLDGDAESW